MCRHRKLIKFAMYIRINGCYLFIHNFKRLFHIVGLSKGAIHFKILGFNREYNHSSLTHLKCDRSHCSRAPQDNECIKNSSESKMHFLLCGNQTHRQFPADFGKKKATRRRKILHPNEWAANDCVREQILLHKQRAARPAGPRQQRLLVSTDRKPLATVFPGGRSWDGSWREARCFALIATCDYVMHRHRRHLKFGGWAAMPVEMSSFFIFLERLQCASYGDLFKWCVTASNVTATRVISIVK